MKVQICTLHYLLRGKKFKSNKRVEEYYYFAKHYFCPTQGKKKLGSNQALGNSNSIISCSWTKMLDLCYLIYRIRTRTTIVWEQLHKSSFNWFNPLWNHKIWKDCVCIQWTKTSKFSSPLLPNHLMHSFVQLKIYISYLENEF